MHFPAKSPQKPLKMDSSSFCCHLCSFKTKYKKGLKRHLINHKGKKLFTCKICKRKFTRKDHAFNHTRTKHKLNPYSCAVCKLTFSYYIETLRHIKRDHREEHQKMLTQKSDQFPSPKKSSQLYYCGYCNANFERKCNVTRHIRNLHPNVLAGKQIDSLQTAELNQEAGEECQEPLRRGFQFDPITSLSSTSKDCNSRNVVASGLNPRVIENNNGNWGNDDTTAEVNPNAVKHLDDNNSMDDVTSALNPTVIAHTEDHTNWNDVNSKANPTVIAHTDDHTNWNDVNSKANPTVITHTDDHSTWNDVNSEANPTATELTNDDNSLNDLTAAELDSKTVKKFSFYVPERIKFIMVQDYDLVTYRNRLFRLPAKNSVQKILNNFLESMAIRGSFLFENLMVITDFIKEMFPLLLRSTLKVNELKQYQTIRGELPDTNLIDIYGGPHLIRVLVIFLPVIVNKFCSPSTPQEVVSEMNAVFDALFNHLEEKRDKVFREAFYCEEDILDQSLQQSN